MSKSDNLQDLLADVANAIREKKGTSELINPQDFSREIKTINHHGYTGHADADGLKAIGWTDEDIDYYQTYGVDWNEEDDHLHLVSDDNKALYGVLTVNNISEYRDRIVYLPKIDTSGVTNMSDKFKGCYRMVAIPMIDTSSAIYMARLFYQCYNLKSVPPIDMSNVTNMLSLFNMCYGLTKSHIKDVSKVTTIDYLYYENPNITSIHFDDIGKMIDIVYAFYDMCRLKSVKLENATNVKNFSNCFARCYCLEELKISKLKCNLWIEWSPLLTKESILYLINNEAADSSITITLHADVYAKYAEDTDVVGALSNHPNVLLASA
jgi:hypothetical protein